jgi:hypothetical protein
VRSPKNDSFDDTDNSTSSSGNVTGNSSGGDGTDADKPETAVVSQNSLNTTTPQNGSSVELKTGKSISKRQAEREAGQGNNTGVVTKVVIGTDGPRNDASTPVVQVSLMKLFLPN